MLIHGMVQLSPRVGCFCAVSNNQTTQRPQPYSCGFFPMSCSHLDMSMDRSSSSSSPSSVTILLSSDSSSVCNNDMESVPSNKAIAVDFKVNRRPPNVFSSVGRRGMGVIPAFVSQGNRWTTPLPAYCTCPWEIVY
jgi:hypothetical protein